ncbi:TRAP transporter small permease [Stappia sp.]|jgi:TRAP-type C4-dicarboxylate transport system permease small subunit|uniref:TRAP transporter small permease n=1 Tax=Stappia sp. TaxID=1870903 RepID=UPI003A9937BF
MERFIKRAAGLLADIGSLVVYLSAALIVYDVVARIAFGKPFAGTADLVAIALVLVTFLQAMKALLQDRLLQMTLLLEKLPERLLSLAMGAANLVGAALFLCLAAIAVEPTMQAYRTHEFFGTDAFRVTAWPVRLAVAVLWCLLAIAFLTKARMSLQRTSR